MSNILQTTLLDLPSDITIYIISFLKPYTFNSFIRICKLFAYLYKDSNISIFIHAYRVAVYKDIIKINKNKCLYNIYGDKCVASIFNNANNEVLNPFCRSHNSNNIHILALYKFLHSCGYNTTISNKNCHIIKICNEWVSNYKDSCEIHKVAHDNVLPETISLCEIATTSLQYIMYILFNKVHIVTNQSYLNKKQINLLIELTTYMTKYNIALFTDDIKPVMDALLSIECSL